jgi:sortase A
MSVILEDGRVARRRAERRARVTFVGVLGEVFITGGVVVLLFLGWQVWLNDLVVGNEQHTQAIAQSETWGKGEAAIPAPVDRADPGPPIVIAEAPGDDVQFANLIIPRFGADYTRPILEGVSVSGALADGIGHYPGTQMPGDVGNVALAGHRTGWGAPLGDIGNLTVGDSIYLETEDGWYKYIFRTFQYVMPTGIDVLSAVPENPEATPTDRILTLTSCNPKLTAAERIIAYSLFDTWYPRAGGPPPELAPTVAAASAAG